MKIIYAGTPEFAAAALESLHEAGHEIVLVLTQPDRPAGRGMQLQASAVKQYAQKHGMPVMQPVSLRLDGKYPDIARQAHDRLESTPHDVMVVAAYGLILPASVLAIPPLGCLNIHGSLLPRWRGAAPIHRAIEAGDQVTGITIMQMDEGLDTGPMLLKQELAIGPDETTGDLHDRLSSLGASMIVDALRRLEAGTLVAQAQPEEGVSYAAKVGKEEAALDFRAPASVLARKVCAFNPFPGATARFNGVPLKIWKALPDPGLALHDVPGAVLEADARDAVLVACGSGALRITQLQKPGGKRLDAEEFLQGFPMQGGSFDLPTAPG